MRISFNQKVFLPLFSLSSQESTLEYTFALSQLEEAPYTDLLKVYEKYEKIELKGQKLKLKEMESMRAKPDCKSSAFRHLRSLQPIETSLLLEKVHAKIFSIKEMQKEAMSIKAMKQVQDKIMGALGEEDWDAVAEM